MKLRKGLSKNCIYPTSPILIVKGAQTQRFLLFKRKAETVLWPSFATEEYCFNIRGGTYYFWFIRGVIRGTAQIAFHDEAEPFVPRRLASCTSLLIVIKYQQSSIKNVRPDIFK